MSQAQPTALIPARGIFRRSERIVSRRVAGQHILVPLASRGVEIDSIFNLNETGAFLWEALDGKRSLQDIAEDVAAEFEVSLGDALQDAQVFLTQLSSLKAVELVGETS